MNELKHEDVMRGLEWCSDLRLCVDCPMRAEGYFSHSGNACRQALMKSALSLLREKDAEIEMLSAENAVYANGVEKVAENYHRQGRAEAITEFAERLKAKIHESVQEYWNSGSGGYYLAEDVDDDIDQIAKELKVEKE